MVHYGDPSLIPGDSDLADCTQHRSCNREIAGSSMLYISKRPSWRILPLVPDGKYVLISSSSIIHILKNPSPQGGTGSGLRGPGFSQERFLMVYSWCSPDPTNMRAGRKKNSECDQRLWKIFFYSPCRKKGKTRFTGTGKQQPLPWFLHVFSLSSSGNQREYREKQGGSTKKTWLNPPAERVWADKKIQYALKAWKSMPGK